MDRLDESLEKFCRICAKNTHQIQNLFEIVHDGVILADMLRHCLKRSVRMIDGFPSNICTICKANLISSYEFIKLCDKSEQFFSIKLDSIERSDDFKPFTQVYSGSRINENLNSNIEMLTLNKYDLDEMSDIHADEDVDFDIMGEVPIDVSGLLCVKNNFDVNRILTEENTEILLSSDTKNRGLPKIPSFRKFFEKSEARTYECYECKRNFSVFSELRQHMNEHDNTKKPFECTTCKMRFVHLNSWFRHRSRHTKNIHECEYCKQSFPSLPTLKHHVQELHKDQLIEYKCTKCPKIFSQHFLLVWHNEWHKKAKQFVCSTCDAVFFNERKLKAHNRDNHLSHLCAECGKSFKTIHLLASHQMLHTNEKPFACDLCPSRFKWKAALKTHMLVHTGKKQHVCDICGSSFTTKGSMKKHKRIHTGDRRYHCETCSMKFYSNDHLKRHKRTHTGERPYVCSYCPRSFSQSNDLTKHIRSHVGENMYRCDQCGESFRLQTELRKHSYTHYNKDDPDSVKAEQSQ